MKKSLIVTGAASLAVAAMPIVGVFAADGTLTQTDTVVVTVDSACSLATSGSEVTPDASTYKATIANGAYNTDITGSTFTITCNDTGGWKLNAIGAGTATGDVTKMDASTNTDSDDIATGTTLDGSVSNWAFKVAKGGSDAANITVTEGYTNFSAVPASATKIAQGTSTAGNSTIAATYGVGISSTQSAGTYTGKVTYTLVHPAGS
ncbi:hypothetical protein IJJ53_03185 [Candidatus Saccharibacteria bacterium]|nr:hypothetical protein [Candidatus Saccharibacteria bacterium]